MDDVEQLRLLLKKYLEVKIESHQSTCDTRLRVSILFDGEDISECYTIFMNE